MSGRVLQDDLKKHARKLYLAVGEDLKPRYSQKQILVLLERKFDEKVSRMTLHRWATDGRWEMARRQAVTEGMQRAALAETTGQDSENESEPRPEPKVIKAAEKAVEEAAGPLSKAKELLTEHIAEYLKGTRAISMSALSLLGDAIREHMQAKTRMKQLIAANVWTPDTVAELKRLEMSVLTPMECVKIARLGNVAQGAQLNIILEGDKTVNMTNVMMTWEGGGLIGPPPPMPRQPEGEQKDADEAR